MRRALVLAMLMALLAVSLFAALGLRTARRPERLRLQRKLVLLSGLPDLALADRSPGIRHRSIADLAGQFGDHPELNEHDPASAVFAPPAQWTGEAAR